MTRFRLSPSRIARYFYHECPRYLRFHAAPSGERKAHGIPLGIPVQGLVSGALIDRGYDWEEALLDGILKGKTQIASGKGHPRERAFGIAETLEALQYLQPGEAIYQPTLVVSKAFLNRFGLAALCDFPPCRPDLIECRAGGDSVPRLRVIDIKASSELKPSHRVQTAIYTLRDCLGTRLLKTRHLLKNRPPRCFHRHRNQKECVVYQQVSS